MKVNTELQFAKSAAVNFWDGEIYTTVLWLLFLLNLSYDCYGLSFWDEFLFYFYLSYLQFSPKLRKIVALTKSRFKI